MATDRKFNVRHGLSAGTGATQKDVVDNVGKVIDVGTLSTLKTAAKDNTVNAINEIYDDLSTLSLIEETFEPMGIADRSHTVISFDNGTRTFTIAPAPGQTEYVVWVKSVKFTFTTAKTVSLGSSPSTGLYYIYFDTNGDLQYRSAYFDWDSDAMVAYVYWNASTSSAPFVADERHGITMDWATHEYLHRTRGAVIANGFDIYNYSTTGDGSADADAQLDIANGTFFDEDLEIAITHSATPTIGTFTQVLQGNAEIPVFYHSGSTGAWVKDAPTTFPAKQSGTTLQYNSFSGGAWTTIPASNNLYVVSWIVATNDITTPIIALLGQAQYSNIGNAEEATFSALDLTNFPVVEFRPLWKVIFRTSSGYPNTPNAYIAGVTDLRQLIETGGEGELVSDHGGLTGLLDDDHPQYIHVTETRAGVTAEFNTTGKITTTNSIGIGTTNPSTKLSVNGYITESTDSGSTYWNVVTQSDIGYGAAQVPLNQYLGQLAFLDDYHPNGLRRDGGGSDDVFIDSNGGLNVTGASTFGGNVNLDDNVKATFGDDGDLEIYHDGSTSYISDVGSGGLNLGGSEVRIKNGAQNEDGLVFTAGGSVELYYDNSKKFETTDAGVTITGITTATTFYATNGTFAAGTDTVTDAALILEEEGSIYTRDAGTFLRNLIQKKSDIIIIGQQNTSVIDGIELKPGVAGSVKLHHGGTTDNVKLQTTTSGIEVTGHIETDTLNVSGVSTFTSTVEITPSSDVKALIIDSTDATTSTNPQITLRGGGPNGIDFRDESDADGLKLVYRTTGNQLIVENSEDATTHLKIDRDDGRVELNYGGNKKFETTTTGIEVTGHIETDTLNVSGVSTFQGNVNLGDGDKAIFGDGDDLEIYHDGSNSYIKDTGDGQFYIRGSAAIHLETAGGSKKYARFVTNGAAELYYDNNKKFETTANGVTVSGGLNASDISTITKTTNGTTLDVVADFDSGRNDTLRVRSARDRDAGIEIANSIRKWNIWIDGNGDDALQFTDNAGNLNIELNHGGSADLFYANSKKLETTNYGIYVTGVDANTSTIGGAATLVLDPAAIGDNTGKVVILGDLQVDGTTTTLNSTTLTIDDKNIVLASGAADSTAADGAGISVDGASATLTYASTGDKWVFNKAPYYNTDRLLTTADEGSGNGLDADTLDTLEASQFLRSDADDTTTGTITFSNGNNTYGTSTALSAEFGVNTSAAGAIKLHGINSGAYGLIQATTNNLHIDTVAGGTYLNYYDGGFISFGTGAAAESARFTGSTGTLTLGTISVTGTASQRLQVAGGAYVSGNVGIGVTNPSYKLEVNGDIKVGELGTLWFSDDSESIEKITNAQGELNLYADSTINFYESDSDDLRFTVDVNNARVFFSNDTNTYIHHPASDTLAITNAGTESLRIDASNNVGIGTDNPTVKLDVRGHIRVTDENSNEGGEIRFGAVSDGIRLYKGSSDNNFYLHQGTSSGNGLYLGSAGSVYVSLDTNNNDNDTKAFIIQKNALQAGTEIFRVAENGNVGIGTDNPTATLDVNGTIAFNSTLTAGQNGKIVFPDNTTIPDNPTNEQHDYITFGTGGSISQVSGRGALMITSSDDSLILANGDVGKNFTDSDISVDSEHMILLSDGAIIVKTNLQNGWGTENDYVFSGGDIEATTFTSTQATGTAPFTVSSTTVVTNLNADKLDGQEGSYYTNASNINAGTLDNARLPQNINVSGIITANTFSGSGASLTNIPNGALDNSTVSYGGVTLSLGGSDATPAFDLQDATGLPVSTGISGLGANVATFLATPSSANLRSAVTDETGSGALVFATSPTLVTPTLGAASATSINASGIITASRFVSNVATGTAPFTVSSTTVVTNLNADLLDGQEGSYYLNTSTNFGGDVSGTYNAIVVANDSHTHSFDNLTGKTSGTGDYSTNADIVSGRGSGGVALTINDGYGNANVTFNHQNGVPEQDGNAARIEVNTDSTSGATIWFEGKSNVSDGVAVGLENWFTMSSNGATCLGNTVWHAGNHGSGSTLDADLLDGEEGSYYTNASNINAGTIDDAYLPATITSDITGNAATATTSTNVVGATNRILYNNATNTTTTSSNLVFNGTNLGIGTDNPTAKLNVSVDNSSIPFLVERTDALAKIEFNFGGGDAATKYTVNNAASYLMGVDDADSDKFKLSYGSSGNATFGTNDLLSITSSGNVGVGTDNPGYKLEVNGSFAATTKSFVIDHPTKEGMKLRYGSLEGPELGIYVRGRLKDNNTIELPEYWTNLVDEETITVNLTPIGKKAPLHSVVDIVDNTVVVESANDVVDCFYTVFGERKDVERLEVEF